MDAPATLRWRLADDDGGQPALFDDGVPGRRDLPGVEYLHVRARSVISRVPGAARLPFAHTINVYRGCAHACTYCFARPTHAYLGLDTGADFEQRIVVKVNAAERLRQELRTPGWRGEHIAMGTNTDPYQPAEGRYRLTRAVIVELLAAGNPFSVLTKSPMILRDLDLLREGAARGLVRCNLSIGTADAGVARLTEPGAPPPARRLEAVARLTEAGVPCGVLVAPVLPGLSDDDGSLRRVVFAALDAGALDVVPILLHLRPGVREHYLGWLTDARPDLVGAHERQYTDPSGYAARGDQTVLANRVRAIAAEHPAAVGRVAAVSPRAARRVTARA